MPKKIHPLPPVDELRRVFRVDGESRLQRKIGGVWRLASRIRGQGQYFCVPYKGRMYQAHRIIWSMHHGRHPECLIDHVNGKRWDNRIENLREATEAQNRWNAQPRTNRVLPRTVVKTIDGYVARVSANYRGYRSPAFEDLELAELAAIELSLRLHGEFSHFLRCESAEGGEVG